MPGCHVLGLFDCKKKRYKKTTTKATQRRGGEKIINYWRSPEQRIMGRESLGFGVEFIFMLLWVFLDTKSCFCHVSLTHKLVVISKVKPFCFALIAENLVGLIVKVGKEHFIKNISLVTAVWILKNHTYQRHPHSEAQSKTWAKSLTCVLPVTCSLHPENDCAFLPLNNSLSSLFLLFSFSFFFLLRSLLVWTKKYFKRLVTLCMRVRVCVLVRWMRP